MIADLIASIPGNLPVLIAGPTASGKSTLALALAEKQGGVIREGMIRSGKGRRDQKLEPRSEGEMRSGGEKQEQKVGGVIKVGETSPFSIAVLVQSISALKMLTCCQL